MKEEGEAIRTRFIGGCGCKPLWFVDETVLASQVGDFNLQSYIIICFI